MASTQLSPAMAVALRTFSRNNGWQVLGTSSVRTGTIVALMNRGLVEYGRHDGEMGHYLTPAGWAHFLDGRPDNAAGRWSLEQCFSEDGWHQVGTEELAHQMAQPLDVNQALCEVMRLAHSDEEDGHAEAEAYLYGTGFRPAEGDFVKLTWKNVGPSGFLSTTTGYIDGKQRPDSISFRLPSDGKPGTSYSSVYRHVVTVRVLATIEEQRRPDRLTEAEALELAYPARKPFLFDWQPGRYAGYRATVNGSEVASLAWRSRKTDPNYVIATPLPVYIPESMRGHDDRLTAQMMAEDLITVWLNSIGAQWKPAELTALPGDITAELEILAGEAEHGGWSGLQRGPGKRAADAILSAVNRLRGGR